MKYKATITVPFMMGSGIRKVVEISNKTTKTQQERNCNIFINFIKSVKIDWYLQLCLIQCCLKRLQSYIWNFTWILHFRLSHELLWSGLLARSLSNDLRTKNKLTYIVRCMLKKVFYHRSYCNERLTWVRNLFWGFKLQPFFTRTRKAQTWNGTADNTKKNSLLVQIAFE